MRPQRTREISTALRHEECHLATDYAKLTENLSRFYDFTEKEVLFIGAAGRQLLDPSMRTRKLIAIDKDAEALQELKAKIVSGLRASEWGLSSLNVEEEALFRVALAYVLHC